MKGIKTLFGSLTLILLFCSSLQAQSSDEFRHAITAAMMKATRFMADSVSENGGYLSHYLPDFSRRWGELEAYPTMVWVQSPGTVSMGNTFLDAYAITHNEYYYKQARKAAKALVWGQLPCGGWNYFINFGGLKSTLQWYNTIGKNGWRLEEFQHYYGNATFDDETTGGAAFFLLRFYLTKLDPAFKTPLYKAIRFVLKSQYPLGGWPQRYPLRHDFQKNGDPDYTSFYTFNDNVGWENIKFLTACYATLNYHDKFYVGGDTRILDAIRRGMNFYLISQGPPPHSGWGEQYTMDLKPAGARTYEPASLDPRYTATNIEILLKFYEMTGDRRYLERIPDAIAWLKKVYLKKAGKDGVYIYPQFIDPNSGEPLYIHRTGSNVVFGHYYADQDTEKTLGHYSSFSRINLKKIQSDYQEISQIPPSIVIEDSPIKAGEPDTRSLSRRYDEVMDYLTSRNNSHHTYSPNKNRIMRIISSLDNEGRWLVTGSSTSHPYIGEPENGNPDTKKYMTTFVGDKYDTSPYRDTSNQKYISTAVYAHNMERLLDYLRWVDVKKTSQ